MKNLTISERDATKIKEMISIDASKEDQFTYVEFKEDTLTDYLKEWR